MPTINLQHFTFSPKYRRPVFVDDQVRDRAAHHIAHICAKKGMHIHALAVENDHVHVFTEIPKTMSISKAVFLIKWYSSRWLRLEFPSLQSYPKHNAFWQRGYFSRSVGGDKRQINQYIQSQGVTPNERL